MQHLNHTQQNGSILLIFILTLPFLILITVYNTQLALTSYQVSRFDQFHTEAQLAADAGADYAVEQISLDNNWTGTNGAVSLHSDSNLRTTFSVSVTGDTTAKVASVTGITYSPTTSTTPNRSVKVYVDLRPVKNGNFSVVAGAGGLYMSNNSKIVGGSVFINGEINLSNSAQIGLSTSPVEVQVAHQICPKPATSAYPRICNSGENGQPITITNPAWIYGKVTANNQTNGSRMSNTGLVTGGNVLPQALPTYDRAAQKAAVATTITGGAASCSGAQTITWQANTKITGNVTVGSKCKVTVKGNIWITGSLALSNSAQLIVDNGLGITMPNIMIDDAAGLSMTNTSQLTSNSSNTGFEIFTFYSTAPCSPDCSTVTGTDLATSRSISTITLGQSSSAANTIFYAYWSQVQLGNSGQVGAVIGQTINLSNTATITFGATAGASTTTWVVKGYRRQ